MSIINRKLLKSQAGTAAFGRGESYFKSGHVGSLRLQKHGVQAKVSGTHQYQVRLTWKDGFYYQCDCPMGEQGDCCKHCVAVGLTWLNQSKQMDDGIVSEDEGIRAWLKGKKKQQLICMLMEAMDADDGLFKHFSLLASASSLDTAALKKSIRDTIETDYLDYYEMRDYERELADVSKMLESMLVNGCVVEVQELALHALDCMGEAYESIDDSNGAAGYEMQCWQDIHLRACEAMPPQTDLQREGLAKLLFERELNADWDEFYGSVETYATLLGEAGTAEFRSLVEVLWKELPVLQPGYNGSHEGRRFKVTSMMEKLAKLSGDVDAQLAVKARDLSSSYAFLQIAELLDAAERFDEAMAWAEKGLVAFKDKPDARLEAYLAKLYAQDKAFDKAIALVWKLFKRQPSVQGWDRLKKFSEQAKNWNSEWQPAALAYIRKQIAKEKKNENRRWYKPDHSLLVQVFLHEGNIASAWLEADTGGCDDRLWETLGEKLSNSEPLKAAFCWQRLVEPLIDQKNKGAYAEAVRVILNVEEWMRKADKGSAFEHWRREIRVQHRAKRNLMALMNENGL